MAQPGPVESTQFPYLQVRWVIQSHRAEAWALADTGFDGYLSLPASQLAPLGAPDTPWRLASGQIIYLPEYRGTVEVLGLPMIIPAVILAVGDEFVLGTAVPNRFRVILDHDRRILVEP